MNRRLFLATAVAGFGTAQMRRRPNVVFILADQWRAQAFGYAGDQNAQTPAIDALASESVNFRNAVSGFPVCSPYRGSLMTGQYAVKHGLVVNDVPLKPNGSTLGDTFQKAGYETAYIGKWHIYGSPDGKFVAVVRELPPPKREKAFESEFAKRHEERFKGVTFDWMDFQRDAAPFPLPNRVDSGGH